jgi:hypothetical protein
MSKLVTISLDAVSYEIWQQLPKNGWKNKSNWVRFHLKKYGINEIEVIEHAGIPHESNGNEIMSARCNWRSGCPVCYSRGELIEAERNSKDEFGQINKDT